MSNEIRKLHLTGPERARMLQEIHGPAAEGTQPVVEKAPGAETPRIRESFFEQPLTAPEIIPAQSGIEVSIGDVVDEPVVQMSDAAQPTIQEAIADLNSQVTQDASGLIDTHGLELKIGKAT